ncbi:unnamed protein product [Tenebrio molitor]|nr:unnamed protein product [Tenebrio molitor]
MVVLTRILFICNNGQLNSLTAEPSSLRQSPQLLLWSFGSCTYSEMPQCTCCCTSKDMSCHQNRPSSPTEEYTTAYRLSFLIRREWRGRADARRVVDVGINK